jgi:predicted Zn-ribbon and HTH transcriptional regulator
MKKYITKQSNIKGAGKGLFTNAFFKKGEVIGLAHVNGQPTKEVGSNHNHNEKNPTANNIKKGNKRYLIASKNLKPGEEITTNYRLQPELEQPEDFEKKKSETMTPQKDGYRTYSPFKNLPYIDVESDTIDSDNIVYDLKLKANNGLTKFIKKNTGLHTLPGAKVIREIPIKRKGGALLTKKVTCKKCGWEWDAEDGGKDITTCHKCGGQGLVHAQDGGTLNEFVGGGLQNISPCQTDEYWDGEKCVKRTINYYNADEDLSKNSEYQDWLIRQSLWQYSDLPYNKQKDLSSFIIRETNNYNNQLPYDFQGQVSRFNETYPETEDFKNDVNIGPYGSKTKFIESLTNDEAAKHSYRLISDNNEIVNNDVYKNTKYFKPFDKSNAFFQKYPPSSWSYHSKLSSDPTRELFSGNWNGSNFKYKKPNTSRIEDNVNRTYLKKFYPELTDEQIDEIVKTDVENPGYITNEFDVNKKRKWVSGQDAEGHDIAKGQDIFKDKNGLIGYKADEIAAYISQYDHYTPSWAEPKELWLKKEEELLNLPTLKPGLIKQQDYELQGIDAYNEALENLEAPSYEPVESNNRRFGKTGSLKHKYDIFIPNNPFKMDVGPGGIRYGKHYPIPKFGMKESTMVDPTTGQIVNKQFRKDRKIQKETGYDRSYYEGSYDEEGNYIPGEIENAEKENRRVNFDHGQMGRKDRKAQEQYNLEYDEYEFRKKFPTLLEDLNITYEDYINQYVPKKQYGGNKDAMTGMMKARLAYANEFGNPAAERMINLPDNPYQFDNGDTGSHYMASMDNYAVPQIQDENGVLQLGDYGPESNEAIRFDSDEDANYFAENYKDVSPGFLNEKQYGGISNNYIEVDLDEDEIEEYRRGGYIVEEIDNYQNGGAYTVKGSNGVYKKVNGKWHVDWNRSGKYQPLSKGDVKARTAVLDKMAKPLYDKDYDEMVAYKNLSTNDKIKKFEPKKEATKEELKKVSERLGRDYKPEDTKLQAVEMVYPEKYLIGPGAGAVGLGSTIARNAAGLGIKGLNKAMSYIPTPVLGALNASMLYEGIKNYSDSDSHVRKSTNRAINDPTFNNVKDAVFDNSMEALNFVGLPFGKAFKGLKKYSKPLINSIDNTIYPTRTYSARLPGGNKTSYEASDLSKKIFKKGDWSTKSLDEARQYLSGSEASGRKGLLTGDDMIFTEYKVPFWKKNVSFDPDVVNLKNLQGVDINKGEFIIPNNKFLYPRKITYIKAVPEHLKTAKTNLSTGDIEYSPSTIPLGPSSPQFASKPYKYIEDQINAASGHNMPLTYTYNPSLGYNQNIPLYNWKQPQFPINKRFKKGGESDDYIELDLTPEEIQRYKESGYIVKELPEMQLGGSPSQVWYQYTGTPWSEARKKGLTDGSEKQNTELRKRILAGEFGKPKSKLDNFMPKNYNSSSSKNKNTKSRWGNVTVKSNDGKPSYRKDDYIDMVQSKDSKTKAEGLAMQAEHKKQLETEKLKKQIENLKDSGFDPKTLLANAKNQRDKIIEKPKVYENLEAIPGINAVRRGSPTGSNDFLNWKNSGAFSWDDNKGLLEQKWFPFSEQISKSIKQQDAEYIKNIGIAAKEKEEADFQYREAMIKENPETSIEEIDQFIQDQKDEEWLRRQPSAENNYNDGPIQMVYPEKYAIGPVKGIIGAPKMILQSPKWFKPTWNATKTAFNTALPFGSKLTKLTAGTLTPKNLLFSGWAAESAYNQGDPNSDVVKAQSNFINNPSWNTFGDGAYETGVNLLGFSGLGLGKQVFKPAYNASKNLIKEFKSSNYITGYNKIKPNLNKFSQNKILLDKSLVKTAGQLPKSLVNRRIKEFVKPIKIKKNTSTGGFNLVEDVVSKSDVKTTSGLRKVLKEDLYRINKLKKENPGIDINNSNLEGYNFEKDQIGKIPEFLKGIEQNKISTEVFGKRFAKQYADKMALINKSDPVFQKIAKESPQYIDEIVTHLKNPVKSNENFLNDLVIQSNTYTRFQKNNKINNGLIGKSMGKRGFTMDVEGVTPSGYYGTQGFKIQPTIDRAQEIFQTPFEQKWSKRIPEFKSDVVLHSDGMHTGKHSDFEKFIKLRRNRLDRKMGNTTSYDDKGFSEFESFGNNNGMPRHIGWETEQHIPDYITNSKYFNQPKHLIFESPTYNTPLENFESIYMGELKGRNDYLRFFKDTGKGFKDGGESTEIELDLTLEEIKDLIAQGYVIEELN